MLTIGVDWPPRSALPRVHVKKIPLFWIVLGYILNFILQIWGLWSQEWIQNLQKKSWAENRVCPQGRARGSVHPGHVECATWPCAHGRSTEVITLAWIAWPWSVKNGEATSHGCMDCTGTSLYVDQLSTHKLQITYAVKPEKTELWIFFCCLFWHFGCSVLLTLKFSLR